MVDDGAIGCCDICGCLIFDYEKHTQTEDGIMAHSSCVEQEVADAENDTYNN